MPGYGGWRGYGADHYAKYGNGSKDNCYGMADGWGDAYAGYGWRYGYGRNGTKNGTDGNGTDNGNSTDGNATDDGNSTDGNKTKKVGGNTYGVDFGTDPRHSFHRVYGWRQHRKPDNIEWWNTLEKDTGVDGMIPTNPLSSHLPTEADNMEEKEIQRARSTNPPADEGEKKGEKKADEKTEKPAEDAKKDAAPAEGAKKDAAPAADGLPAELAGADLTPKTAAAQTISFMQKNSTTPPKSLKKEAPKDSKQPEKKTMTVDGMKVFVDELEGEEDKYSIEYQLTQTDMEESNLEISEESNQEKLYKLLQLQN